MCSTVNVHFLTVFIFINHQFRKDLRRFLCIWWNNMTFYFPFRNSQVISSCFLSSCYSKLRDWTNSKQLILTRYDITRYNSEHNNYLYVVFSILKFWWLCPDHFSKMTVAPFSISVVTAGDSLFSPRKLWIRNEIEMKVREIMITQVDKEFKPISKNKGS